MRPFGNILSKPYLDTDGEHSVRKLNRIFDAGFLSIFMLGVCLTALIAFLPVSGAVIAPGEITVATHVKEITHPFGGVVVKILVKDGEFVRKGQPLIQLDSTVSGGVLELTRLGIDRLSAKEARLRATQEGAKMVSFPAPLELSAQSNSETRAALSDELKNFYLTEKVRFDQVQQWKAKISQTNAEIMSLLSQVSALDRQSSLLQQELQQTKGLYENRLTTLDRLNALERAAVGVDAQVASARAGIVEARARAAEFRAQMYLADSASRSEAAMELAQVETAIADLNKQRVVTSDQYDRMLVRAPQDGVVDKLQVRTPGGVVPAGKMLMEIVPLREGVIAMARVKPRDIDKISQRQLVRLRFISFSGRETPDLSGSVEFVAVNINDATVSNDAFYPVEITIPDDELKKLGRAKIPIGLPVEVFIQTDRRTILQYITRPLMDQLNRSLRE